MAIWSNLVHFGLSRLISKSLSRVFRPLRKVKIWSGLDPFNFFVPFISWITAEAIENVYFWKEWISALFDMACRVQHSNFDNG